MSSTRGQDVTHLQFLDSLRGVAILAVVVYHALIASFGVHSLNWVGLFRDFRAPAALLILQPVCFGYLGVAIFFAISGFCIHLSFEKPNSRSWRIFFIRRWFRIYPPYLVCLILFTFVHPGQEPVTLRQFLTHAALIHNFLPHHYLSINASFWSIAIEVQLYLLYPLAWYASRMLGWSKVLLLTGVIQGVIFTISVFASLPHWIALSPLAYWLSWCLGARAADLFLKKEVPEIPSFIFWLLACSIPAAYLLRPTVGLTFLLTAALTTCVICHAVRRHGELTSRTLSHLGLVSYSLYLIHQPLLTWVANLVRFVAPGERPLVTFACCVMSIPFLCLVSAGFYRWIEIPSIALGKRWANKQTEPAADSLGIFGYISRLNQKIVGRRLKGVNV